MPVRKFIRKKRVKRSTPWYSKKYSVGDIASAAWKGVKYIKTLVNAEKKYIDVSSTGANFSYNGGVIHLSPVAQGDGESAREGNSIYTCGIAFRGVVYMNTTEENTQARIVIFKDTMNTGSTPTVDDVIHTIGTTIAPMSPLEGTTRGRYKILYNKFLSLSKTGETNKIFKTWIPLRTHVKYTGSASTDEFKNQIYLLYISSENTNQPTIRYYSRMYYHDN